MRTLVLQHIACEPPGYYEDVLLGRGAVIHRVEVDEGDALPDWHDFEVIVAMGGPMSVNDEAEFPWLAAEKRLIADAVRAGTPFWGACLGVQLLASSLGGRVHPGPEPEVGMLPVTLTAQGLADPVFAGLPPELLTLQWHGDTFELPDGAVLLAGSAAYPNQAFRYGKRAYGVQFHLEVTPAMAKEWAEVPAYRESLDRTLGPGAFPALLDSLERNIEVLGESARRVFSQWLEHAVPSRSERSGGGARADAAPFVSIAPR